VSSAAEPHVRPPFSAQSLASAVLGLVGASLLLGLWEAAPRLGWVREQSIPPFSRVARELYEVVQLTQFATVLGESAGRWALGFGIAIVVGVTVGVLMGRFRPVYHLLDPLLVVSYPVPKAALILIFIFWWGAGNLSQVTIIVIGCLIPIVISSYHGAHGVEERLLWSAQGLGTGRAKGLVTVVLPAALPQILSGIRIAIAISIFTLLAAELLIRGSGIGSYMFSNLDLGRNLRVWALAVFLALTGFTLDFLYVRVVRRVFPWTEGQV
jgi:ABC-type nitrate/sulfonate/bicarbonate transport system permease component